MIHQIKATLQVFSAVVDTKGNRTWAFTWTDLPSYRHFSGATSCRNVCLIYQELDLEAAEVLVTHQKMGIQNFNHMIRNWPSAGCTSRELAAWIRKELEPQK